MDNKAAVLLKGGYNPQDIRTHARSEYDQLVQGGYSPEEANKYTFGEYGYRFDKDQNDAARAVDLINYARETPNSKATQEWEEAVDTEVYTKKAQVMYLGKGLGMDESEVQVPKENEDDDGFTIKQAFRQGWRNSTTSLAFYPPENVKDVNPEDISIWDQAAMMVGQGLGDTPTDIAGAVMGGAVATPSANPLLIMGGAFAGAAATSEGMRVWLTEQWEKGEVNSMEDALQRAGKVIVAGGNEVALNLPLGMGVGKAAQTAAYAFPQVANKTLNMLRLAAAPAAVEVVGGAAQSAIREQRLPTSDDIILGAFNMGVNRVQSIYSEKLRYAFARKNETPQDVLRRMRAEPDVMEDMASENLIQPAKEGGAFRTIYGLTLGKDKDDYSWLTWESDLKVTREHLDELVVLDKAEREFNPVPEDSARPRRFYETEIMETHAKAQDLERLGNRKDPTNYWFYTNEQAALSKADDLNKSSENSKVIEIAGEAAMWRPVAYQVPADKKMLSVHTNEDPKLYEAYKMAFGEDGQTAFDQADIIRRFKYLDPSLLSVFYHTPERNLTGVDPEDGNVARTIGQSYPGIQWFAHGRERVTIWDKSVLMPYDPDVRSEAMDLDTSTQAINDSISVGEATAAKEPSTFEKAERGYAEIVDGLKPLNAGGTTGNWRNSYTAARLYAGVDGLARHWLTYGRTAFLDAETFIQGEGRRTIGKSFLRVVHGGRTDVGKQTPESVQAVKALGKILQNKDLEGTSEIAKEWDAMFNRGDISKRDYGLGVGRLTEARNSLTNADDPFNLFRVFLIAKHAQDLHVKGQETGLSPDAVRAVAKNPYLNQRFAEAVKDMRGYQQALLQYKVDGGLISKESMDKILNGSPNYVPMERVMDDGSIGTNYAPSVGSERVIIDPLESIVRQTQYVLKAVEKNSVIKLIAKEHGEIIQGAEDPQHAMTLDEALLARATDAGTNESEIIKYRENGREMKARVPMAIVRATAELSPSNARDANAFMRWGTKGANLFRLGHILPPTFAITSAIRDQIMAPINAKGEYVPFYDFGRGVKALFDVKGIDGFPDMESTHAAWLKSLGSNSSLISSHRRYTQENMEAIMKSAVPHNAIPFTERAIRSIIRYANPLNTGKGALDGLKNVAEYTEDASRIGEYLRNVEAGRSEAEAGMASRENPVDFARMGASMQALNSLSAFLNASIQGADRFARQIVSRPAETVARITAGIVFPTMLLSMANQSYIQENPESDISWALQEGPDWQKHAYWRVPLGNVVFTIPKPHELMPITAMAESFVEFMYQDNPGYNFVEKLWQEDYPQLLARSFMMEPMMGLSAVVPTIALPPLEAVMNYSNFTQQPIIPADKLKVLPPYRYNRSTTELTKALSKTLYEAGFGQIGTMSDKLISPTTIDHLVKGITGTLGKSAWNTVDASLRMAGRLPDVPRMAKKWHESVGMRAFFMQFPNSGSKSVDMFYGKANDVSKLGDTINMLLKTGNPRDVMEAQKLIGSGAIMRVDNIRKTISQLSDWIVKVDMLPNETPEEKRDIITNLQMTRIKLARIGLNYIKQVEETWEKSKANKN